MTLFKLASKALGVLLIIAPSLAAIAMAYKQNIFALDGCVRLSSGPPLQSSALPPMPSPSTPVSCKLTLRVVKVEADDVLNLREQPSPRGSILATIPPNASGMIDLRERHGEWRRVEFGRTGWVNGAYVSEDGATCASMPTTSVPRGASSRPQPSS